MSFTEAIQTCFSKYATFEGRARRSEYWYFFLFNFIVTMVISVLVNALSLPPFISGLVSLALLVPGLAVAWRRFHDIGKSGAWYLLSLIPIIGTIIVIIWLCKDSEPGENQFGPNPKGMDDMQVY